MCPDDSLDDLVGSVGDGAPVDWELEETRGALRLGAVRALRDVARMADFNRALQRSGRGTETTPGAEASTPGVSRWGTFTLLERVGAGAAGEVWRAWDASLHREVAIKFLQSGAAERDRPDHTSLVDEARALARVRHPGVAARSIRSDPRWAAFLKKAGLDPG